MLASWAQRRDRAKACLIVGAAVGLMLLLAPVARAEEPTPVLDAVENTLREVSPGTEGQAWFRADGNALVRDGDEPDSWLLQTPKCWGQVADCALRPGTEHLLATIQDEIGRATESVDLATLIVFPDGGFKTAIVEGLKAALAVTPDLQVRILGGVFPPGYSLFAIPQIYLNSIVTALGPFAANPRISVATMETLWAQSFNHTKLVVVDGDVAITGGHNYWAKSYLNEPNPISDVSMRLMGPAAAATHKFVDVLWGWTCANRFDPVKVWWARTDAVTACPASLASDDDVEPIGDVPAIALGSLGLGIAPNGSSTWDPPHELDFDATCLAPVPAFLKIFPDWVNLSTEFDIANANQEALRQMIAGATEHVFISQQDLIYLCTPVTSRYDARLFDVIADKLIAGVPVTIVNSSPGANLDAIQTYSNISSLEEVSRPILRKLAQKLGNAQAAVTAACDHLQLAPYRFGPSGTWTNGKPFGQHTKMLMVDDRAFYIGSLNLYPTRLQEHGFVIEDAAVTATMKSAYLDPLWSWSRNAATFDPEQGICGAQVPTGAISATGLGLSVSGAIESGDLEVVRDAQGGVVSVTVDASIGKSDVSIAAHRVTSTIYVGTISLTDGTSATAMYGAIAGRLDQLTPTRLGGSATVVRTAPGQGWGTLRFTVDDGA